MGGMTPEASQVRKTTFFGWPARRSGTAFACRPGHAEFLREVVAGFGAAGRLRLVSMDPGDGPVGMTWSLTAGGAEFGFKSAYDEAWRSAAPGIQVVAAAIDAAQQAGAWVDSCAAPTERYLFELMPDRIPIGTLVFPPRGPAGVALGGTIRTLTALRDRRNARRARSAERP